MGTSGWERALSGWTREMRAAANKQSTIVLRCNHIRQFARHLRRGPWTACRDDLIGWLARPQMSPEYRRSVRSSLAGFYGWAHAEGLIEINPAGRLPRVRVPRGRPRPADDEDIIAALMTASPRELLMVRLMAEEGMRRAETAGADSRNVEFAGLRVCGKGDRTRVIPLTPELRRILTGLPPGPLFPNPRTGRPLTPGHVGKLVSALLPPGVTPHMLRHAAATAWHRLGLDLMEIRDLLGHASVATTQVYVLPDASDARRTVEAAAARFRRPARPRVTSLPG